MIDEYRAGNKKSYLHERQILRWIEYIAKGADAFNAKGLVHKEIRASNILIDDAMKLVICDFAQAAEVPKGEKITKFKC